MPRRPGGLMELMEGAFSGEDLDSEVFEEKEVRRRFVRRVFSIVALMLVPPFTLSFVPFINDDIMEFFHYNAMYLLIPGTLVYMVCLLVVTCCDKPRRIFPLNVILLVLLSLSISLVTSCVASKYYLIVPAVAMGVTLLTVLLIGLLAKYGSWDVTGCGMLLCALSILLLVYGLVTIVMAFVYPIKILHTIYSGLAALLMVFFLWFDLQLIFGGRRYEINADEVIYASASLFADIVLIFLYLMSFIGDLFGE